MLACSLQDGPTAQHTRPPRGADGATWVQAQGPGVSGARGAQGLSPTVRVCTRACMCAVFVLCVVHAFVRCVAWCACTRVLHCVVRRVCVCVVHVPRVNTCAVCVRTCVRGEHHLTSPTPRTGSAAPGRSVCSPPGTCSAPCGAPTPRVPSSARKTRGHRAHSPSGSPHSVHCDSVEREREEAVTQGLGQSHRRSGDSSAHSQQASQGPGSLASHTAAVNICARRPREKSLSHAGPREDALPTAGIRRPVL